MNEEWTEILSDYNKAKNALWCPKGKGNWHREEELGRYYIVEGIAAKNRPQCPKDKLDAIIKAFKHFKMIS